MTIEVDEKQRCRKGREKGERTWKLDEIVSNFDWTRVATSRSRIIWSRTDNQRDTLLEENNRLSELAYSRIWPWIWASQKIQRCQEVSKTVFYPYWSTLQGQNFELSFSSRIYRKLKRWARKDLLWLRILHSYPKISKGWIIVKE